MMQDTAAGSGAPESLQLQLRQELATGETLVWAARPRKRGHPLLSLFLVCFGLVFTTIALLWMAGAFGVGATASRAAGGGLGGGGFALCGTPFLVVGSLVIISPILLRRAAARTVYAITDRRALVIQPTPFRGKLVRSFLPAQLGTLERIERKDGSGDLVFARSIETFGTAGSVDLRTYPRGFLNIENVREVEQLLRANFGLG